MRRNWVVGGIVVAAVVIIAIILGLVYLRDSDSESSSLTTTEWAGKVCTSLSDWRSSITSLADVSGGTLTRDTLRKKLTDAQVATEQLITDLENIGPPETASGTQLKNELQQSGDQLEKSYENLKAGAQDALDADSTVGFLQGLAKLAPDFQKLLNEISSTIQTLESSNVAGDSADEVKQGFQNAQSCQDLRSEQD
jgi:hypothetical protein